MAHGGRGNVDEFDNQLDDPASGGFSDHPGQDPASLSVLEHLKSLSIRGKLTLVYIVAVLIALLLWLHWVIALMSVLAFLVSAAPLYVWWAQIRYSCPLDLVVRSFGLGMIGMFWSVVGLMLFCMVGPLGMALRVLLEGVAHFITLFVILVGLEEMMKVILALWSKKDVAIGRETKAHQIAATATSVGYAVGFSFLMIMFLDLMIDMVLDIKEDSASGVVVGLFVLALTTLFGTPLHVLSGYLVGLEVKREAPFMKAALYSFALRSLFQINIIVWIVIATSWQMIVLGILLTNILLCTAMVRRIKKVEATLPIEYLQRVGYLQAFGYGVLPGDDVDEVEIPNSMDVNNLV